MPTAHKPVQAARRPARIPSPRQQQVTANLSLMSRTWPTLSEPQRQSFELLGRQWSPTPGQSSAHGYTVFLALNGIRLNALQSEILTDCPPRPDRIADLPPLAVHAALAPAPSAAHAALAPAPSAVQAAAAPAPSQLSLPTFALALHGPRFDTPCQVLATRPLSPGVSRPKPQDFRAVTLLPSLPGGPIDITNAYLSQFPAPALGMKIALQIIPITDNGFRGRPSAHLATAHQASPPTPILGCMSSPPALLPAMEALRLEPILESRKESDHGILRSQSKELAAPARPSSTDPEAPAHASSAETHGPPPLRHPSKARSLSLRHPSKARSLSLRHPSKARSLSLRHPRIGAGGLPLPLPAPLPLSEGQGPGDGVLPPAQQPGDGVPPPPPFDTPPQTGYHIPTLSKKAPPPMAEETKFTEGLRDAIIGKSRICDVNGDEGKLIYAGYDIHDLAQHATFEEVVYLLWHIKLPTQSELDELNNHLDQHRALPAEVLAALKAFPTSAPPMDALRTAVSLLGLYDPDTGDESTQANMHKSVRLVAQTGTVVAALARLKAGQEPIAPKPGLRTAANFLYMLKGEEPSPIEAHALDVALILHADHEINASTFAARVTIATLTDMYSAVVSAIGTLAGPLHGGANTNVMRTLEKIGTVGNAETVVTQMLGSGQKIPGIGHAVYKALDPRAISLREMSQQLAQSTGDSHWFDLSEAVQQAADKALAAKGKTTLKANVDFFSASVYHMLGIPTEQFTPIFAISRISGWTAHILEQLENNKIMRPRALYEGPRNLVVTPIAERV